MASFVTGSPLAVASRARAPPEEVPYRDADPPVSARRASMFLDLTLHGIRRRVPAVASTPPVVVEYLETVGEELGQRCVGHPIGRSAAHQDERRPLTQPIECDGRAIPRCDLVHRSLLSSRARDPRVLPYP
jgi:hypothetical protein